MKLLQHLGLQETALERRLKISISRDLKILAKALWVQLLYFQFGYSLDIAYDLALAKVAGLIRSEDLGFPMWREMQ